MTSAARVSNERDLVAEAARRAYEEAGGDVRAATAALEKAARSRRGLRDALTDPLISQACYDAIRQQCRGARRAIWTPPVHGKADLASDSVNRVTQLAAGTLLMFPLPGGKRLGQANRDEISAAAEFYSRQSDDMATKARWLRLVAQSLPSDSKASDVLTDARLRELQEVARAD